MQICRGTYDRSNILKMEQDLLSALEWRVAVHTPMGVARCLLEILPMRLPSCVAEDVLAACQQRVHLALVNADCLSCMSLAMGVDCLWSTLSECGSLCLEEKQTHWTALSYLCQFDAIGRGLIGTGSPDDRAIVSKLTESFRSKALVSTYGAGDRLSSSLTCVIQVARQA